MREIREGATPEQIAEASARNLLPVPWIGPEDVAEAVLYLASDHTRYVTGTQLLLDAGATDAVDTNFMWRRKTMAAIPEMTSFHVGVAAEAFAAGYFAQAGCDVSVQYGANQPEYDLLVARDTSFLRISVKGSQSGSWGLMQGYKKGRSYHEAIDAWAASHKPHTVYCFVQFWGVALCHAPRAYLADVPEIVDYMKASRNATGATILS